MSFRNRLLVSGAPKAGKSCLVQSLSDSQMISSNIYQNAPHLAPEGTEDVMLDYGETGLDDDRFLEIYGTPGQRRFQFMWKTLCKRSIGLIIMIDNRRPNPIGDLQIYLENFGDLISHRSIVVGLNFADAPGGLSPEEYSQYLRTAGWSIPVVPLDPRVRADALYALSILLASLTV